MALTNYERQKRWREKNRVIYNLRRRNARKNLGVAASESHAATGSGVVTHHVSNGSAVNTGYNLPASPPRTTIEALRELVRVEQEKPATEARTKPDVVGGIYRNDSGGVISKFAWEKLQKMKAKEGGYTLDEYSQ